MLAGATLEPVFTRENRTQCSLPFIIYLLAEAGSHDDVTEKVVGTQEPAWLVRDPPRSTSPTNLQSHNGAAPGLARRDDPPYHPPHPVKPVKARIGTPVNTSAPSHIPPVDLESPHIFGGLGVLVELPTALNTFEGHVNFEYPRSAGYDFWTWWTCLMRGNEDHCVDSDAGDMDCF